MPRHQLQQINVPDIMKKAKRCSNVLFFSVPFLRAALIGSSWICFVSCWCDCLLFVLVSEHHFSVGFSMCYNFFRMRKQDKLPSALDDFPDNSKHMFGTQWLCHLSNHRPTWLTNWPTKWTADQPFVLFPQYSQRYIVCSAGSSLIAFC